MILYLYTSTYPTMFRERNFSGCPTVEEFMKMGCPKFQAGSFEHETNLLLVHSKMYALADKYDMPCLQATCVTKFGFDFPIYYKEDDLQNLVNALPHVYSSTPPSQTALKQRAVALVQRSYDDIMREPMLKTQLETACVQSGQLVRDVLSNLYEHRRHCE
jgi:hypothetical protein